jgi:hypothetical protein
VPGLFDRAAVPDGCKQCAVCQGFSGMA